MITPQLTEQYGHVERVSFARAIFSVRSCAYAGFKSNPKTAAAAPPIVVSFRKSRRVGFMLGPSFAGRKEGKTPRKLLNMTYKLQCQVVIFQKQAFCIAAKFLVPKALAGASKMRWPDFSKGDIPNSIGARYNSVDN